MMGCKTNPDMRYWPGKPRCCLWAASDCRKTHRNQVSYRVGGRGGVGGVGVACRAMQSVALLSDAYRPSILPGYIRYGACLGGLRGTGMQMSTFILMVIY